MKLEKSCLLLCAIAAIAWSWPWDSPEPKKTEEEQKRPAQVSPSKFGESRLPADQKAPSAPAPQQKGEPEIKVRETAGASWEPSPGPRPLQFQPAKPRSSVSAEKLQQELRRSIQLQETRQKELERQMQTIKTSLERAKIYNRILTNMKPQKKAAVSPTLQAVNQEKIRLMHAKAGKLAAALPAKPAPRAASSAIQAKQAAQIIPPAKTPTPRSETAAKTS